MRIQHNIMAMNAYRNYGNNTSALSKNLEKLSSGYRINRAGDDAAGLAISEKMRAQIQGLNAAQKNVKDGISLVKTAEGAMQEIQDMLSRMKYLATQSANGTYDDEVDRKALQDEVNQLNEEINRIADSANFNGTKLLDGSLGGGAAKSSGGAAITTSLDTTTVDAVTGVYTATVAGVADNLEDGATAKFEFTLSNGKTITVELEMTSDSGFDLVIDGETVTQLAQGNGTDKVPNDADIMGALKTALADALKNDFDVDVKSGSLEFTAKEAGTDAPSLTGASYSVKKADGTTAAGTFATGTGTPAEPEKIAIAQGKFDTYDPSTDKDDLEDFIFEINGQKFIFVANASDAEGIDEDVTVIIGDVASAGSDDIAFQLGRALGMDVEWDGAKSQFVFSGSSSSGGSGSGLKLQIGDTADSYNQLVVSVDDMHAKAIGVAGVDITNIDSAAAAIDVIKDAINTVSATRGTLGAIQNRLEHTQKNLSVMAENIQDAESTIRDTDVADEMMAYTKNNILIQSAQAMLAQANAVPQGVLQLLG